MVRRAAAMIVMVLLSSASAWGRGELTDAGRLRIIISSSPSWASFRLLGDPTIYFTPSEVFLSGGKACVLRLEKEGYEPVLLRIWPGSPSGEANTALGEANGPWSVEALSYVQYRAAGDMLLVTLKSLADRIPEPAPASPPLMSDSESETTPPKIDRAEKLKELERLRKKGKISAARYRVLKKKILEDAP